MSESDFPKFSVLCVDDEANILSSLRRMLRASNYNLYFAESGFLGLQILKEQEIDLVISDMRMPEMNGAEFLAKVAARHPDVVRMLLTGYADLETTVQAINEGKIYSYISKPWEEGELNLTIERALEGKYLRQEKERLRRLTVAQNRQLSELNESLEQKVIERTKQLADSHLDLEKAHLELQRSYHASIPVFASLVQMREGDCSGHSKRVSEMARDTAAQMELSKTQVRDVYNAGLLHDIGKISLPDDLLKKPWSKLSAEGKTEVRKHPVRAEALLMSMEPLQETATIIRHHHEHYDGKGYPDNLQGKDIPMGARILCIANEYDNLRHGRLSDEVYNREDALKYMLASPKYDQQVLMAFHEVIKRFEEDIHESSERRLSPDELTPGMILTRNLLSGDGMLLLTKGHTLQDTMIQRLRRFTGQVDGGLVAHVSAEGR